MFILGLTISEESTHKAKSLKLIVSGNNNVNHDRHKQHFETICNMSTTQSTFSIRKFIYWS
jgi:hypothetical protein